MTKTTSQPPPGKTLRQPRNANAACAQGADVCELFLAELKARRARLQKLLHLVWQEAERPPARTAVRSCARCGGVHVRRTA